MDVSNPRIPIASPDGEDRVTRGLVCVTSTDVPSAGTNNMIEWHEMLLVMTNRTPVC